MNCSTCDMDSGQGTLYQYRGTLRCGGCVLNAANALEIDRDAYKAQIERYKSSIAITDRNFRGMQEDRDHWRGVAQGIDDDLADANARADAAERDRDALSLVLQRLVEWMRTRPVIGDGRQRAQRMTAEEAIAMIESALAGGHESAHKGEA